MIQVYLLVERPESASNRLFWVAKGPNRGKPLTAAGLRTIFRYHRGLTGIVGGHPHALRHTDLHAAYLEYLRRTGRGNAAYSWAARVFFRRWPDPRGWAAESLQTRLSADASTRPIITFLMLHQALRPGYDYLLERKLSSIWREIKDSPLGPDLDRFMTAAAELGFAERVRLATGSQVPVRLLIQTARRLDQLTLADLAEFSAACRDRQQRTGKNHFGVFLARIDPDLDSIASLDRRKHIEPYLTWLVDAVNTKNDEPITTADRSRRVLALMGFLTDITEWGWPQAPPRTLVFATTTPNSRNCCPAISPSTSTASSPRCCANSQATNSPRPPCGCNAAAGCGSGNCSTSSWTASTKYPTTAAG